MSMSVIKSLQKLKVSKGGNKVKLDTCIERQTFM